VGFLQEVDGFRDCWMGDFGGAGAPVPKDKRR